MVLQDSRCRPVVLLLLDSSPLPSAVRVAWSCPRWSHLSRCSALPVGTVTTPSPPSCLLLCSLFQLMFGRFGQVVEKKKSITLQDISAVRRRLPVLLPVLLLLLLLLLLSSALCLFSSSLQEERRQLSSMLGCEISSMLCVPVASRATGQVVALACAFNKQGGQRYLSIYLSSPLPHTIPLSLLYN